MVSSGEIAADFKYMARTCRRMRQSRPLLECRLRQHSCECRFHYDLYRLIIFLEKLNILLPPPAPVISGSHHCYRRFLFKIHPWKYVVYSLTIFIKWTFFFNWICPLDTTWNCHSVGWEPDNRNKLFPYYLKRLANFLMYVKLGVVQGLK